MTRHERALREIEADLRRRAAEAHAVYPGQMLDRFMLAILDEVDATMCVNGLMPSAHNASGDGHEV